MVSELKKRIESGKIFLGIRESLKNLKDMEKAIVASDCRSETIEMLKSRNINVEIRDITKEEMAKKLELDFKCEVFGIKK